MLNKVLKYAGISLLCASLIGCAQDKVQITVGSKPFTESMVLAEMIAQLAENEGIDVQRSMSFGFTSTMMEATKQGIIDIYPEYNGTSLTFLGQAPSSDGARSTETVNTLFEPQGLQLGASFGFSNDYVMVMTQERASELGVSKISDLASLSDPVTFAIEQDFLERPADGLQQMNRHYGITGSTALTFETGTEGKDQQISALLDRSADVAELFATDGQIAEYGLVVLEDDKSFFPIYEAMPLLRADALTRVEGLSSVLEKLAGAITAADMQAMNKAVDLDAQTPASVATSFLVSKGLLPESADTGGPEQLVVAADPSVGRSSTTAKALRAVRAGFSGRDIKLENTATPLEALSDGSARVAMVGAEAFYTLDDSGPVANTNAEAFAVLGYRTAHLIGLRNGPGSISEMSKIATGPEGSSSSKVLDMVLHSLGSSENVEITRSDSSIADLVAGLVNGDYDGVFVMAQQGGREITSALLNASVGLISLDQWAEGGHTARFSFIRPATIAAQTYSSQFKPVSSVSTQLVLAGPVEQIQGTGEVGPGTAGTGDSGIVPISADAVNAIREAIGASDVVDPALPVHASLVPVVSVVDKSLPFSVNVSVVNILMIAFAIWIIYLCFLPSPRSFTLPDDD